MEIAIHFLVSLVVGAALLWLSIRVVDGYNHNNTLGAAFGWSFLFALSSLVPSFFAIFPLVAFITVLLRYYELSVLRMIGVVLFQIGVAFALSLGLAALHVAR